MRVRYTLRAQADLDATIVIWMLGHQQPSAAIRNTVTVHLIDFYAATPVACDGASGTESKLQGATLSLKR